MPPFFLLLPALTDPSPLPRLRPRRRLPLRLLCRRLRLRRPRLLLRLVLLIWLARGPRRRDEAALWWLHRCRLPRGAASSSSWFGRAPRRPRTSLNWLPTRTSLPSRTRRRAADEILAELPLSRADGAAAYLLLTFLAMSRMDEPLRPLSRATAAHTRRSKDGSLAMRDALEDDAACGGLLSRSWLPPRMVVSDLEYAESREWPLVGRSTLARIDSSSLLWLSLFWLALGPGPRLDALDGLLLLLVCGV